MSGMTPEQMKDTAAKQSKYVKLEDGETITLVLVECKAVPQQRDPEKETYRYTLKYPDGSVKCLESASTGFLRKMADFVGKTVTITREGEGPETRYTPE